jgi:hypothetical protein
MIKRLCAVAGLAGVLATGCGVQHLSPATAPAKEVPPDVEMPTDPPAPGTGRVILDTNGEPAKVVEITGSATASSRGYSATIVGIRPLCTTPCVVDLPYGSHPLVMRSLSDDTHRSEAELEVGARAKVFRHTLGERTNGGGLRTLGASLLTVGVLAATTGAILWLVGSSTSSGSDLGSTGQLITGLGAGGIVVSIPFLVVDRPTERAGATTQWNLPGAGGRPPASPSFPSGAAVDRL